MNFYTWVVLDRPGAAELAREVLRGVFSPARRFPGAALRLRVSGPWLPSEILRLGANEPPRVTLLELESDEWRGRLLSDEALAAIEGAPMGPVARGGLAWPQDAALGALSRAFGGALGMAWQDDPDLAYAALARGGALSWSLAVRPPSHRVRFDGEHISRLRGHDARDSVDRVEVLREGLQRLSATSVRLTPDEALTFPDVLAELLLETEELVL